MQSDVKTPHWRRLFAVSIAAAAYIAAFILGNKIGASHSRSLESDVWVTEGSLFVISAAIALGLSGLVMELSGPTIAEKTARAIGRLRARMRRRWKRDRTHAEFAKVEAGLYGSVVAVTCIAVLLFLPLQAFAILVAAVALYFNARVVVSLCRSAAYQPLWSALLVAVFGAAGGYLLA